MNPKKELEQLYRDLQTKKFREGEAKGLTETIGDEINRQLTPAFKELGKALTDKVEQAFDGIERKISVEMPEMQFPEIPAPVVNVEAPVVNVPAPVVNVSPAAVNIPETKFPEQVPYPTEFSLKGVDKLKPLPVMMMDDKGRYAQFPVSMGASGGKADFFTIKDIQTSAGNSVIDNDGFVKITGSLSSSPFATYYASDAVGSVNIVQSITLETRQVSGAIDSMYITGAAASTFQEIMNPDGRVKVELPTGSSGLTDTELRATAVPVSQVSGATWSVVVNEIFGSTATNVVNPDGRLKVELPTGASGLTDTELRATAVPVSQVSGASDSVSIVSSITLPVSVADTIDVRQVSGASWSTTVLPTATGLNETNTNVLRAVLMTDSVSSVYVNNPVNQGDAATALRVVVAGNSDLSTVVNSGTLTGITNAIETRQVSGTIDSVNVLTMPAVVVTSITNSIAAMVVDSTGVAYSGSNPVPVDLATALSSGVDSINTLQLSGAIDSVFMTGAADSFCVYEATTTNPTAKADGADVRPMADKLGRQVFRSIHVRDLITTAYVALSNGTETTLTTAAAGTFRDLVMITATNNSSAATQLDIRATSGGNVVHTMYLPATTGPVGFSPTTPWPQDSTGNAWTIDMPDQTGTTVYVSALFSTEI